MDRPFFRKRKARSEGLPASAGEGDNLTMDQSAARAALFRLEEAGAFVPAKLREQLERLYGDLLRDTGHANTDDLIILSPDQFKGAVSAALIVGVAHADFQPQEAVAEESATDELDRPEADTLADALEAA